MLGLEWVAAPSDSGLDPRTGSCLGNRLWPDCTGGLCLDVLKRGDLQNLKGQRILANNVPGDTMAVHRVEGPKEHCLFWAMNDQRIPLQSPRSERTDHE